MSVYSQAVTQLKNNWSKASCYAMDIRSIELFERLAGADPDTDKKVILPALEELCLALPEIETEAEVMRDIDDMAPCTPCVFLSIRKSLAELKTFVREKVDTGILKDSALKKGIVDVLENAGIWTVDDLCALTREELVKLPQIKKVRADEIEKFLAQRNRHLAEDEPPEPVLIQESIFDPPKETPGRDDSLREGRELYRILGGSPLSLKPLCDCFEKCRRRKVYELIRRKGIVSEVTRGQYRLNPGYEDWGTLLPLGEYKDVFYIAWNEKGFSSLYRIIREEMGKQRKEILPPPRKRVKRSKEVMA